MLQIFLIRSISSDQKQTFMIKHCLENFVSAVDCVLAQTHHHTVFLILFYAVGHTENKYRSGYI